MFAVPFTVKRIIKRIPSDWLAWQVFFTPWEERYPVRAGGYLKNTLIACLMRMVYRKTNEASLFLNSSRACARWLILFFMDGLNSAKVTW